MYLTCQLKKSHQSRYQSLLVTREEEATWASFLRPQRVLSLHWGKMRGSTRSRTAQEQSAHSGSDHARWENGSAEMTPDEPCSPYAPCALWFEGKSSISPSRSQWRLYGVRAFPSASSFSALDLVAATDMWNTKKQQGDGGQSTSQCQDL